MLKLLRRVLFWGSLAQRTQEAVAEMLEVQHVEAGAVLFSEGSSLDARRYFYIFVDGHIEMFRQVSPPRVSVSPPHSPATRHSIRPPLSGRTPSLP